MGRSAATCCWLVALFRGQVEAIRSTHDVTGNSSDDRSAAFQCPHGCDECCKAYNRFLGFKRVDTQHFKCIIHPDEEKADLALPPREGCTQPRMRDSDPTLAKSLCEFTEQELSEGAAAQMHECTYDLHLKSYGEFINGGRACSLTPVGHFAGIGVVGKVIDMMYFDVENSFPGAGGVCNVKGKEYEEAHMMDAVCARRCTNAASCRRCTGDVKKDMCTHLADDLSQGRLDKFSLAVWAAAVGPMVNVSGFKDQTSDPRPLRKFQIPGWDVKEVSYEVPEGDSEIDLANGGFACMMSKLQALPIVDDLTEDRNCYVDDLHEPGLGEQSALTPRSPYDLRTLYFDRYQLYQAPFHFDVPSDLLLTDTALEMLVFQSIGAHRVEMLTGDSETTGLNPLIPVLPGVGDYASHVPSAARGAAKFVVRLEGLFEDVPLRDGMARWGGNAYFSGAGKLLALQYNGRTEVPGGRHWEYFKFVFRSSLVSAITAFEHLVSTHILVSETLALASAETLPVTNPLRKLLLPHTYKTLAINFKAANNLFPRGMLVHRASPYGDDAFQPADGSTAVLWKKASILKLEKFETVYNRYQEMRRALSGQMPEMPLFEDGILLYAKIKEYVTQFVRSHYSIIERSSNVCEVKDHDVQRFVRRFFEINDAGTADFYPAEFRSADSDCDALAGLLTECIFIVTGWHTHVGQVSDFFRDTRFAATSWKEGELQARPKHAMLMMLLAATTNAVLPKLTQDRSDPLLETDHESWRLNSVLKEFHASMARVQDEVAARNERRNASGQLRYHQMEPGSVDWGVMV